MNDKEKKHELFELCTTPGASLPPGAAQWIFDLLVTGKLDKGERQTIRYRFPRYYKYARILASVVYAIATSIAVAIGAVFYGWVGALEALGLVVIGVGLDRAQRAFWAFCKRRIAERNVRSS